NPAGSFHGHLLVMKGWGGKKYDSVAINTTVVTGFTTSASAFVVMKHRLCGSKYPKMSVFHRLI
ncbi:MAG: hypothetical protein ACE1ZG_07885, partial [Gammaproteobacteria bacterium]